MKQNDSQFLELYLFNLLGIYSMERPKSGSAFLFSAILKTYMNEIKIDPALSSFS